MRGEFARSANANIAASIGFIFDFMHQNADGA